MGPNYAWPGNIRELEQCVRNVMIRKSYKPVRQSSMAVGGSAIERFARDVTAGRFTLEELIEQYVSIVYVAEECHYGRASKRLSMDWRTLKQKLNPELVKTFTTR
jgi:DNA-binding NtrC family response regulator